MCLLVEQKFGTPERTQSLLDELLKYQNADGGWTWLTGGPSDAFATGQSLYALSLSNLPADHTAVRRAQRHLLDTQDKDGFWSVPPQSISSTTAEARLKRLEPIYRYWSTAWATIGLLRTLASSS